MLTNGVIPMPPAIRIAARARSASSVSVPKGPSSVSGEPTGKAPSRRLKTLSRMRVATVRPASNGALTIENVWRASCESAGVVPGNTRSIAWPGSKAKPAGLLK